MSKTPPFPDHTGLATRGERLVPLDEFEREVQDHGKQLSESERLARIEAFLERRRDDSVAEGPFARVAVFGGVYNNHLALSELLEDAARRRVDAVYCLGDLGGFGPFPEKLRPLLDQGDVRCIQGNYEESLAAGEDDCNCGYADPRDNHFAALSYDYTASRISPDFRRWMGSLPGRRRVRVGSRQLLLVHGSPRRINEFLFRSTSPEAYLERLADECRADGFLCTHTGLHWHRRLASGRDVVNVGVIGRPANDGTTDVHYCVIEARDDDVSVECHRLSYDHESLAAEMRSEALPEEFVETVLTGWWTTCLEILPARERAASRF